MKKATSLSRYREKTEDAFLEVWADYGSHLWRYLSIKQTQEAITIYRDLKRWLSSYLIYPAKDDEHILAALLQAAIEATKHVSPNSQPPSTPNNRSWQTYLSLLAKANLNEQEKIVADLSFLRCDPLLISYLLNIRLDDTRKILRQVRMKLM